MITYTVNLDWSAKCLKVITVTGYKPYEINIQQAEDQRIDFLKKAIEKQILALIDEGLQWVVVSGQMGVELWAAEVALQLKEEYPIQLALIPPFENQDNRWPDSYQLIYQQIAEQADFYRPLYRGDYQGPYQYRAKNQWYVEQTDGCVLLMDEEYPGSTQYFYRIAQKQENYPIYLITPSDIEEVIEEIRMMDPQYWQD